jgi:hypothetical protein
MTWNLRLVNMLGEDPYVEIREVFYDHDGSLLGHTTATMGGEDIEDIRTYLKWALEALDKPILNFGDENGNIRKDSKGE